MEIKYWSDIACPFCYIGSNRMKRAMKEVGIYDQTPLKFKSFQLDPAAPRQTTEKYINHFTGGDQSQEPQAKQRMAAIEQMAHNDGLAMRINQVVPTNTMDAHRLIKFAETKNNPALTENVISSFYKVYFSSGKSIADPDVLTAAAVKAGLKRDEVEMVLTSDRFQQDVINDEREAQKSGIQAAPFFVINNKYAISGAQPYEVFVKALEQIQAAEVQEA